MTISLLKYYLVDYFKNTEFFSWKSNHLFYNLHSSTTMHSATILATDVAAPRLLLPHLHELYNRSTLLPNAKGDSNERSRPQHLAIRNFKREPKWFLRYLFRANAHSGKKVTKTAPCSKAATNGRMDERRRRRRSPWKPKCCGRDVSWISVAILARIPCHTKRYYSSVRFKLPSTIVSLTKKTCSLCTSQICMMKT